MAALEFKFSSDQQHQLEAIEATCDLFRGQQFIGSVFSADSGRKGQTAIGELMVGHGNELRVAPGQLLDNLHAVQEEGCLPATDVLTDGRLRDFTVEMETGTGKTYVYIRSIYELNRRYGITKFVIVVPSVAIREGVLKSLQTTRRHFETLYDRTPLDYFVYDSKDMGPVGNFATSSSIQVMVINIDAFNKGLEKDGTAKEGNLFHRPSEKLTGGFSPRELVSACKPVVIIDEPQSVDNTKQAKAAIKSLNPLFVLALLGHAQAGLQHDLPPHAGRRLRAPPGEGHLRGLDQGRGEPQRRVREARVRQVRPVLRQGVHRRAPGRRHAEAQGRHGEDRQRPLPEERREQRLRERLGGQQHRRRSGRRVHRVPERRGARARRGAGRRQRGGRQARADPPHHRGPPGPPVRAVAARREGALALLHRPRRPIPRLRARSPRRPVRPDV